MKKYELLKDDTITFAGKTLYRIRYLRDFVDINKGDLGGYIEKEDNLSHDGNARVCGNAQVRGNAEVFGNAKVYGDAEVCGNARVCGNAQVRGNAEVRGNARVYDDSVCEVLSPLNIIGIEYNTTLTDNNIHIGCKTFTFTKALALASRWKTTTLKYEEAKTIEDEKKLIVDAIKLRLKQLEKKA